MNARTAEQTTTSKKDSDCLDFEKANSELDDKYRLGYVAFSRARDMLVLACLEKINDATKKKLSNMKVELYDGQTSKKNTQKPPNHTDKSAAQKKTSKNTEYYNKHRPK